MRHTTTHVAQLNLISHQKVPLNRNPNLSSFYFTEALFRLTNWTIQLYIVLIFILFNHSHLLKNTYPVRFLGLVNAVGGCSQVTTTKFPRLSSFQLYPMRLSTYIVSSIPEIVLHLLSNECSGPTYCSRSNSMRQ